MYKRKSTFNERDVIFLYEYGRRAMIERERRINKLKQKSREREGKPGDESCAIYNRAIRHCVEKQRAMQCLCPFLILIFIFCIETKITNKTLCFANIISTNSHLTKILIRSVWFSVILLN